MTRIGDYFDDSGTPTAGELPNHDDRRTKRAEVGRVLSGRERDVVLLELARLLEQQYTAQWKRWSFDDEHCERYVGAEQERSLGEEAERRVEQELRVIHAKLEPLGKRRLRAAGSFGGGLVRNESEEDSKFEREV